MKKTDVLALSLLLSLCAAPSFASVSTGQLSLSPSIGGYTFDGRQHLKTSTAYSLRAGYMLTDALGVEGTFDYAMSRSSVAPKDVSVFRYGGDLLYHFMPQSRLVPFVAAGAAGTNLSGPKNLVSTRKTKASYDYGVGLKYLITDAIAVRADVRHILSTYDARTYSNVEYTIGLHLPFGGKGLAKQAAYQVAEEPAQPVQTAQPPVEKTPPPAPAEAAQPKAAAPAPAQVQPAPAPVEAKPIPAAPPIDSDGDGVPDAIDLCPNTPAGVAVDRNGCPSPAKAPEAKVEQPAAVSGEATAAPAGHSTVTGVSVGEGFIEIQVQGAVGAYKTMQLTKPERLAIDIPGATTTVTRKTTAINRMGISQARIGSHPDHVRVVIDAAGSSFPSFHITKSEKGLRITFR